MTLQQGDRMTFVITERQTDVLTGIIRGLTNAQIAATYGISESCIKHHVGNLLARFHVENRLGLLVAMRAPKPTARMQRLAA